MRIVAVWESREAWERFLEERLMPVLMAVLGPERMAGGPPPTEELDATVLLRP